MFIGDGKVELENCGGERTGLEPSFHFVDELTES